MRRFLVVTLAIAAVACGGASDPGQSAGQAGGDTQLLKDTQAAVNDVVRNAMDCPAARAAWPEAKRKLDAAEQRIQTATGRTTLQTLRRQAQNVIDACPQ